VDHVQQRLSEVRLVKVRCSEDKRVGRGDAPEEEALDVAHTLVHVGGRELQTVLLVRHVATHGLGVMRRVIVAAQDLDLAVGGPYTRLDLVQGRDEALTGVGAHATANGELGDLLDGDVHVDSSGVGTGRAEGEDVNRPGFSEMHDRGLVGSNLDAEGTASHLGRLAHTTALRGEETHVGHGELFRREGAFYATASQPNRW